MTSTRPKRPFGAGMYLVFMAATLVVALVSSIAAALFETTTGITGFWVKAVVFAFTMVAISLLCVWWWRGIDEAAREAHKWAWWWGGTAGTGIGAILLVSVRFGENGLIPTAGLSPGDLIAGGMMSILLFQMVGYAVAWAAWWLRHR